MATSRRYHRKKGSSSRKGKRNVSRGRRSRKGHRRFTRKTIRGGEKLLELSDLELTEGKLEELRKSNKSILDVLNGVIVKKKTKNNEELYTIEIVDTEYKPPPPSIQYFILEQIRIYLLSLESFKQEEKKEYPVDEKYLVGIKRNIDVLFSKDVVNVIERENIMIHWIMPNILERFRSYKSSISLVDNYQEEIKLKDTKSDDIKTKTIADLKTMGFDDTLLGKFLDRDVPSEIDQVEKMMESIKSNFMCSVETAGFKINNEIIDITKTQDEIRTYIDTMLNQNNNVVKTLSNTLKINENNIKMLVHNYINLNIIAYKNGYNTTEKLQIFDKKIYYITLIIESYALENVELFRNKSFNSVLTSKYDVLYQELIKPQDTANDSFDKDIPRVVLKPINQTQIKKGFMSSLFKSETKEMIHFKFATKFIYLNRSEKKQFLSEKTSKNLVDLKTKNPITKLPDTGTVESDDDDVTERKRILNPKIDLIDSNTTIILTNFGAKIVNPNIAPLLYLRKELETFINTSRGYKGTTEKKEYVSKECYPLKPAVFRKRVLNYFKTLIADKENYQLVKLDT